MIYVPPKKGIPAKRKTLTEEEKTVKKLNSLIKEVEEIKLDLNDSYEEKQELIDEKLKEIDEIVKNAGDLTIEATLIIQNLRDEAIKVIQSIEPEKGERGEPGIAGKDADEQRIIDEVLKKLPKTPEIDLQAIENAILGKVPKLDETGLIRKIIAKLPNKKGDLKIITEKIETDPMSVIDRILELAEEGKFKIKSNYIDGLEQTINAFWNQVGRRGYLHGGGISNITGLITAGSNISIAGSGTSTDPYVISSTASGGITSINTDTTAAQTLAVGTTGTDFNIADDLAGTHTFNLPTASATVRGALSSADWTTFNNKFTLPSLTAGSVLFSNGTTIAQDNANFFWDDTNNRLGLGTNAPASEFVVQRNSDDATGVGVRLIANSASPTTNDVVGMIDFRGRNSVGTQISYNRLVSSIDDPLNGAEDGRFRIDSTINGVIVSFLEIADGVVNIGSDSLDADISLLSQLGSPAVFVENSTGLVGVGTNSPSAKLHAISTTEQLRLGYNTTNYASFTVSSTTKLSIGFAGTVSTIAIGNSAGSSNNSGNAIFLGGNAGANATTSDNSIFLGYNAGVTALGSKNAIYIGVSAGTLDAVDNSASGTSIAIGNFSGTGGFKDSIALGHGVINSATNQLNIGNVLYITALYASDSQSSTPITTATYTLPGFTSAGFVKTSAAGLLSVDTASYQPLDATLTSIAAISFVQGDLMYASGTDTLTRLAKDTNATRYLSNTGASNNPAWAQVNLANGVTGDLPFANLTQGSALSVLGVTGNATADVASIAAGSDHQVLRRSGTSLAFGAVNLAQSAAVTGILGVANGGTGTSTAFTLGSVVFAGASGVYTQDNANFFYDTSTDRLGLGTATPDARLDVVVSAIATTSTDGAILQNETAATVGVATQYSPRLRFRGHAWKSAATAASQTQDWVIENIPTAGSANTSGALAFKSSNNGAGYVEWLRLSNTSALGPVMSISMPMSAIITVSTTYAAYNLLSLFNDTNYLNLQTASGSGSTNYIVNGTGLSTSDASFNTIKTYAVGSEERVNLTANIIGLDIGTSNSAGFIISGTFKNSAGTVTQVGTTIVTMANEDNASTDVQFAISGTNVLVQVKGIGTDSWQWSCVLEANYLVGAL